MDRLHALLRQYEIHGADRMHIADIGADHGYLSQMILDAGFCGKLIVTDIAEKPLEVARRNLGEHPRIDYRLCNGLDGDFSKSQMIFIAGMGGDLIADILTRASSLREDALFVIQPMTHFQEVFRVLKERYLHSYFASERDKHYRIMVFGGGSDAALCREALSCLSIPWLEDFSERALSPAREDGCSERVLSENLEDAVAFFENKRRQQEGITETAGKSGNSALHSRCISRRARIEEILGILTAAPGDRTFKPSFEANSQ